MTTLKPFVADEQTVGITWSDKGSLRMTATVRGDVLHYAVEWVYPNGQTVLLHEYQWPEKWRITESFRLIIKGGDDNETQE